MVESDPTTTEFECLKNQLKSDDPDSRINAIIGLGKEESKAAVRMLINVANAIPPKRAIGFIPKGTPPNLEEQLAAVAALSQIDDDRANEFILNLCKYVSGGYSESTSDSTDYGGAWKHRKPVYDHYRSYRRFPNARGYLARELNHESVSFGDYSETTDFGESKRTLSEVLGDDETGKVLTDAHARVQQRLKVKTDVK